MKINGKGPFAIDLHRNVRSISLQFERHGCDLAPQSQVKSCIAQTTIEIDDALYTFTALDIGLWSRLEKSFVCVGRFRIEFETGAGSCQRDVVIGFVRIEPYSALQQIVGESPMPLEVIQFGKRGDADRITIIKLKRPSQDRGGLADLAKSNESHTRQRVSAPVALVELDHTVCL